MELQNEKYPTAKQTFFHRYKGRLLTAHRHETGMWRSIIIAVWLLTCTMTAVSSLGMPTRLGAGIGMLLAIVLCTMALLLSAAIVAAILSLLPVPLPGYSIGSMLYTLGLLFFIAQKAEADLLLSILLAAGLTGIGIGVGLIGWVFFNKRIQRSIKIALTACIGIGIILLMLPDFHKQTETVSMQQDNTSAAPQFDDPSLPGNYDYDFFTYGSGRDKHQKVYGSLTDIQSESVDASAYIKNWSDAKEKYWGFTANNLPLNGRVWMPEGNGPFPIVFMVHGNHLMEYASDGGYEYLGKLLASRGIIAISVAENFLNYSAWSGIPNDDYKVRAWLLLKHLQQVQSFAAESGNPFYGKIDFKKTGLIGHSRGGQAVAMAADREKWFSKDNHLPAKSSYQIQAVAALAPTDTEVNDKKPRLKDTYYLTIQGMQDADVNHFYGAQQYERTEFPNDPKRFKAALSIANANHVHFNTGWGDHDLSFPRGLFLDLRSLIPAGDQRQIAKVYISAFFETALHGQDQYTDLFHDYQNGLSYLPHTHYYNRYKDGSYSPIAEFATGSKRERLLTGSFSAVHHMKSKIQTKQESGLKLSWQDKGSYSIQANSSLINTAGQDSQAALTFTMSNLTQNAVKADIELTDHAGDTAVLPLDDYHPVQAVSRSPYTWSALLNKHILDGKFSGKHDPVFQAYEIPLTAFQEKYPRFALADWEKVTFHFQNGPGKVLIRSIGLTKR